MTKVQQDQVKSALDRYTQKSVVSAKQARATLVREGIYQENGKLTPNYVEERETA